MLTRPQVQRFTAESGLRDVMIAEKEVVLTFLLQFLSECGVLDKLAFKGGTCIRKMFVGGQGRFSTDLDFTGLEDHDHEDVILEMMDAVEKPFHGIEFAVPDDGYYETLDRLSWSVSLAYVHEWNPEGSEIKVQISRRETPTLPTQRLPHIEQTYFRQLPFEPTAITCLALPEALAEKVRACYQRNKARDIYDLGLFATRPLDRALVRRLVVLKLWQVRDTFDPARLMRKFQEGRDFNWDDLGQLVRRTMVVDRDRITADCARGFAFLADLTEEERTLASDQYQRERDLWERLSRGIRERT